MSRPKISRRLKSLVDQGVVERTVTTDWPPKTLYALNREGSSPPDVRTGRPGSLRGSPSRAEVWRRMRTELRAKLLPVLVPACLAVCLVMAFCAVLQDREQIRSLEAEIRVNQEKARSTSESLHRASRLLEDITEKLSDTNLALENRTSQLVQIRSQLAAVESMLTGPEPFSVSKVEISGCTTVKTGYPRVPSWQPSQPEGADT